MIKKRVQPFSPAQQLERLKGWHEAIESRPTQPLYDHAVALIDSWNALEQCQCAQDNGSFAGRGRTHNDRPPLAELFNNAEFGLYPTPELMLTLIDAWRTYKESAGALTLEEAFFGKTRPRSGNYAARAMKNRNDLGISLRMRGYMEQGKTKAYAAELLADEFQVSEESIKRTIEPFNADEIEQSEK